MTENKRPDIYLRGGLEPHGWFGTRTLRPHETFEVTLVPVENPSRTHKRLTRTFPGSTPLTLSLSEDGVVSFGNEKKVVKVAAASLENVRIATEFPIEMVAPLHGVPDSPLPKIRRRIVADLTRGSK